MTKPFDVTKFRKSITKSISGLGIGFNDPTDWISTGNYALNYLISGDFNRGIPLGKVTVLAGESGSGKSFIASGNLVRNAQKEGIYVIGFFYPVVPKEQARIRVQISAAHEREHLDKAIAAFTKVGKELKIIN